MTKPSLDDHAAALETALLEYIVTYGLTDRARAAFAASKPNCPCAPHGSNRSCPTEEGPT